MRGARAGASGVARARRAAGPGNLLGYTLAPGSYNGLVVIGYCKVDGDVTINGNVRIADGGYLDAAYLGTKLTINGDVHVGNDAKLGLGCSFGYHDCGISPPAWRGAVTVNGNVVANNALTMYLDFTTIHGNVVSNGGGISLATIRRRRTDSYSPSRTT